ncbi:MAG: hypothetical protein GF330_13075 [Candidatus Eisenbacteria bacterium]|nr:hypothetical protein [Candidatus Eisenbacteria bacterium]
MRRMLWGWIAVALLAGGSPAEAEWAIDLEGGFAFSGYNDIRIPGDGGTEFSFSEELSTESAPYARLRVGRRWDDRHDLRLLAAPLRLSAEGTLDRDLDFAGARFAAGEALEGTYRFDSYRVTYRYLFSISRRIDAAIGLTAKIRDAEIRVASDERTASKANTGFVPLIAFAFDWALSDGVHLRVEGDALVGPQGRAEDLFIGLTHPLSGHMLLRGGYRLLEGGADVDEVYNFTLIHYAALGVEVVP